MRTWREPHPLQIHNGHTGKPHSFDYLMDRLVDWGGYIKWNGSWGGGFGAQYQIKVQGRDDYEWTVYGSSPSEAVRKALKEYEQHLQDEQDTAALLRAYRAGLVVA